MTAVDAWLGRSVTEGKADKRGEREREMEGGRGREEREGIEGEGGEGEGACIISMEGGRGGGSRGREGERTILPVRRNGGSNLLSLFNARLLLSPDLLVELLVVHNRMLLQHFGE